MKWLGVLSGFGMLGFGVLGCRLPEPSTVGTDSQGTVEHTSYPASNATETARTGDPDDEAHAVTPVEALQAQPTPAAGPDNQPRPVVPSALDTGTRLDRIDARINAYAPKVDDVELRSRARALAILEDVKEGRAAVERYCVRPSETPDAKADPELEERLSKLERTLDELERLVGL